jgi:DHA1 family bicyclomycin/chloramphenicol resistance-like MFS transporter
MTQRFARNAIVLGLLSAIGPFAIDMYLPALPSMQADLHADTAAVQWSLTAFFIAVGVCQLVYGPVSDMVGRKAPLYFGMAVFIAGAIGCALAPTIEWLIFFRFVQGVGACASMVIPRAVVRDLHTGSEAARLISLIMLVFSISPILAPLSGSAIVAFGAWHGIFWVMAMAALLSFALIAVFLPETRPAEQRIRSSLGSVFSGYGALLRDRHFLGLTFIGGLGMASFFAFLSNSAFVYIDHFGLSPTEYSVAFSINAIGFIGSSQFSSFLARRYGFRRVVRTAVLVYALLAVVLLGITLAGFESMFAMMALLFVAFACLGLVIPSTAVLALESHGPIAGMASALMGTLQLASGAISITIASALFDGTPTAMIVVIALCAVGALILALLTLRSGAAGVPQAAE